MENVLHDNTWSSELRLWVQVLKNQRSRAFSVVLEASLKQRLGCWFAFFCPLRAKQHLSIRNGATRTHRAAGLQHAPCPPPPLPSLSKGLPWPGLFLASF